MIFSGGSAYDKAGRTPSITVLHGKATTVLEMEHNVVDFITLCETPWTSGKIFIHERVYIYIVNNLYLPLWAIVTLFILTIFLVVYLIAFCYKSVVFTSLLLNDTLFM